MENAPNAQNSRSGGGEDERNRGTGRKRSREEAFALPREVGPVIGTQAAPTAHSAVGGLAGVGAKERKRRRNQRCRQRRQQKAVARAEARWLRLLKEVLEDTGRTLAEEDRQRFGDVNLGKFLFLFLLLQQPIHLPPLAFFQAQTIIKGMRERGHPMVPKKKKKNTDQSLATAMSDQLKLDVPDLTLALRDLQLAPKRGVDLEELYKALCNLNLSPEG